MSKRARLAIALALLLLSAAPAGAQEPAPPPRVEVDVPGLERVLPSVVKVYGAGGFVGVPAYGTGVIVEPRGFVLTAWSIALRTPALKVVTHDGRRFPAEVWRADPALGVALLKVRSPGAGFAALPLAEVAVRAGQEVWAVGNAFGIIYGDEVPAISRGVVTAVTTAERTGAAVLRLPHALRDVILTDVPNNPGTQGGPLVTRDGAFVGLLGRLVESRATNTILNYAVPAASLRTWVREGVAATTASPDAATLPGRPEPGPAVETGLRLVRTHLARPPMPYVERVVRGSPADAAGARPDDLVFRVDGRTVYTCRDLDEALATRRPGEQVTLTVKRGDEVVHLSLVLGRAAAGSGE